jgi:hypothetical protein
VGTFEDILSIYKGEVEEHWIHKASICAQEKYAQFMLSKEINDSFK